MTSHPNFDRTQAALNASRQGDYAPAFDAFTDDILMENGPGAGPWHRARGKDDLALLLLEFASSLGETFHQDGHCVYADDRVAISLIHETGTAPSGDGNRMNAAEFRQLYPFPSKRFHALLNSLFKVLCNFPSRYLFAIGLLPLFSLRWRVPPILDCIPKQSDS